MKLSIIALVTLLPACAATPQQKSDAADTAYGVDQADCVRTASSREQADSCRAAKRQMWDAGSEAGK